ncbi:cupin domain-containing protein [Spirosoma radiotolerans]|uniref:cupin domain-containing protein n=1 Tax=Spirosoma radiotolerans TaxID=1379870 RepID=UPI000695C2EA|nr:cupin domain-containing protein [Spirosoma radiotolerans]
MNNTNTLVSQNHEQLIVLTTLITLQIPTAATEGRYAVWEEMVPPLAGPPPHSHPDEEIFYIIDGSFEFMLHEPNNLIPATTGAVVRVPAHALHTYKNVGATTGKLLTIAMPGKLEAYFRAVGKPVASAQDIPDLTQVPDFANLDVADFLRLAPQHEVAFYLPQMAV